MSTPTLGGQGIPLAYLAHENEYRSLVSKYMSRQIDASGFVDQYFALWKRDRDAEWQHIGRGRAPDPDEQSLCDSLDLIFSACDCYCDRPEGPYEISETQFREEVAAVWRQRWSHDAD